MVHWLTRLNSWFGFAEPAQFVEHKDGGYFASVATGEQIHALVYQGTAAPMLEKTSDVSA